MLKFFNASQKNSIKKLNLILDKRKSGQSSKLPSVKRILANVKKNGDKAVIKYEKKFSKLRSNPKKLKFSKTEISQISKSINKKLKKSIDIAYNRIKNFHSKQKFLPFKIRDKFNNELLYKYSPIDRSEYMCQVEQQVIKYSSYELYSCKCCRC